MAKVSDVKQSKYLDKKDCGANGIKVVIAGYTHEDVSRTDEPTDMKYVLSFRDGKRADGTHGEIKAICLNLTNAERIETILGSDDLDDWIGGEIILFNDESVMFGQKKTGGIRVYVPQKTPGVAQEQYRGENPPPPTDADVPAEEPV